VTAAYGLVAERLTAFASARAATITRLAPLSQAQLDFSPRPGRWSIGEVADHLRLSESLWRAEVSRLVALARAGRPPVLTHAFADINAAPLHIPDTILSLLELPLGIMTRFVPDAVMGVLMEFPIVPTRNPDAATPRPRRRGDELRSELTAALDQTRQLIEGNGDLDFERMVSEHPLMGANNVPAVLVLLTRHERRHQGQIDAVMRDARFPGASRFV
jgi:uncharacterized damage-inducible protein DinB